MAVEPRTWYLLDREGSLLAYGRPRREDEATDTLELTLSRPGRLLQRCLVGGGRDVWLQSPGGELFPARVERLFFDPQAGRICLLRRQAPSASARPS